MTNATAQATIHTNYGDIVVDLFGNHAPLTVENFIGLADGLKSGSTPAAAEHEHSALQRCGVPPYYQGLHDSRR